MPEEADNLQDNPRYNVREEGTDAAAQGSFCQTGEKMKDVDADTVLHWLIRSKGMVSSDARISYFAVQVTSTGRI